MPVVVEVFSNFETHFAASCRCGEVALSPEGGGGVDSHTERDQDARRKFWIKSVKETNLGVAPALFVPEEIPL